MKQLLLASILILAPSSWGALLQYETAGSVSPGFFFFTIDGKQHQRLLCDEFNPNVTTSMYNSTVVTLADLMTDNAGAQMTTLRMSGVSSSTALMFYTYVAYLDAKAYAGTAQASDVVLANRWMIDGLKNGKTADFLREGNTGGSGPLSQGAMNLLTEVQSQASFFINPTFRIFTSPLDASHARLTQEQTGYIDDPASGAVAEPKTLLGFAVGLSAIAFLRWRKLALMTDTATSEG